jgi:ribosomal protein S18 acetylase RimI-like enzyme
MNLSQIRYRQATRDDLVTIVTLLMEDELGSTREQLTDPLDPGYIDAFNKITTDPNQYLMVVESNSQLIATCHLTIIPSLTFCGQTRLQIEAVRVAKQYRNRGVGEWMINKAIAYGKSRGASIVQLTTNKERTAANRFYQRLGFTASHYGMKRYLKPTSIKS